MAVFVGTWPFAEPAVRAAAQLVAEGLSPLEAMVRGINGFDLCF